MSMPRLQNRITTLRCPRPAKSTPLLRRKLLGVPIIVLIAVVLSLTIISGLVYAATSQTVHHTGTIVTGTNILAYTDASLGSLATTINLGDLSQGGISTQQVYIYNSGSKNVTVTESYANSDTADIIYTPTSDTVHLLSPGSGYAFTYTISATSTASLGDFSFDMIYTAV